MLTTDAIKIDLTDTPEKFRPAAEEILTQLTNLLEKLCRLEDKYSVLQKQLHQKERIITFENGVRKEITQHDTLKSKFKNLYSQLLDPHCTVEMLAQRRDCVHGASYPSNFNCVHTGCTIAFTIEKHK